MTPKPAYLSYPLESPASGTFAPRNDAPGSYAVVKPPIRGLLPYLGNLISVTPNRARLLPRSDSHPTEKQAMLAHIPTEKASTGLGVPTRDTARHWRERCELRNKQYAEPKASLGRQPGTREHQQSAPWTEAKRHRAIFAFYIGLLLGSGKQPTSGSSIPAPHIAKPCDNHFMERALLHAQHLSAPPDPNANTQGSSGETPDDAQATPSNRSRRLPTAIHGFLDAQEWKSIERVGRRQLLVLCSIEKLLREEGSIQDTFLSDPAIFEENLTISCGAFEKKDQGSIHKTPPDEAICPRALGNLGGEILRATSGLAGVCLLSTRRQLPAPNPAFPPYPNPIPIESLPKVSFHQQSPVKQAIIPQAGNMLGDSL